MVIVAREPDGRWYVTFTVHAAELEPPPQTGHAVGAGLGVKDFAVISNGERITNPRHLEHTAQNLARYQRRQARCKKDSANRAKAKAKAARAHRKVRSARQDFPHRASTHLVRDNDLIVIENLNVAGMIRNRRLARNLVVIDRWYPSSKTRPACGHPLAGLSLGTRHWTCPSCRARHDRDINAARNILAAGLAVARGSPGDACGGDIRHSGSSRVRSPVKQEPQPARAGIPVLQGEE